DNVSGKAGGELSRWTATGKEEDSLLTYRMLACDYDRTLATDAVMTSEPLKALAELKEAGWLSGLVTGRELQDLLNICIDIRLFDLVVAENGAVLYLPHTREAIDLAPPPPAEFLKELGKRGIPFSKGRVIVASPAEYLPEVTRLIQAMRLDLEAILNRDSAMFLPKGIDKGSGLTAGASRIGIPLDQIVAIGDAENDIPFLRVCGFSVAVENAIDDLKREADFVTSLPNGQGVAQFIREHVLSPSGATLPAAKPVRS
ncbi:MAG TPA: HAD family hydrolase, partial [Blastocatellia bacterium]